MFVNLYVFWFDNLQVCETKVIFSAVKSSGDNFKGNITFDTLVINLGDGFDAGSGTFVVPTSGTYRLSFSSQSGFDKNDFTEVYVHKNGKTVLTIWDSNESEKGDANNVSYTWLINLTRGDRVNLSSENYLHADTRYQVTFTGELVHI